LDSRDIFDLLIYGVVIIGLIFAARRLYQDLTRPLDDEPKDKKHRR